MSRSLVVILVAIVAIYIAKKIYTVPDLPQLDADPWWGPGEPRDQNTNIRPFRIDIPQKVGKLWMNWNWYSYNIAGPVIGTMICLQEVDDLKARLALPPRLAPSLEDSFFHYGVNSAAMSAILKYWTESYDWKKREQKLNSYPHFKWVCFVLVNILQIAIHKTYLIRNIRMLWVSTFKYIRENSMPV